DKDWINRLNLRLTYGVNGNIDRSAAFLPLINVSSSLDPYTQQHTASISNYGNPTLRWERTKSLNLRIDFSILHSQLYGTLNFYNKNGNDLIVSQSISAVNGTTRQKFNNGSMVNRGVEIELGATLPISDNFSWRGSANFSYNKNKITQF